MHVQQSDMGVPVHCQGNCRVPGQFLRGFRGYSAFDDKRDEGKTENATTRRRTPRWMAYKDQIEKALKEQPDLTLSELRQSLGTMLDRTTLCRALQRLKLTFKKKS